MSLPTERQSRQARTPLWLKRLNVEHTLLTNLVFDRKTTAAATLQIVENNTGAVRENTASKTFSKDRVKSCKSRGLRTTPLKWSNQNYQQKDLIQSTILHESEFVKNTQRNKEYCSHLTFSEKIWKPVTVVNMAWDQSLPQKDTSPTPTPYKQLRVFSAKLNMSQQMRRSILHKISSDFKETLARGERIAPIIDDDFK